MVNEVLRERLRRLLLRVQKPAQYLGGEYGAVVKDHRAVRGTLCLAFPDTYALGMSHHGLQVLYSIMNRHPQWACERVFSPWIDFEQALRRAGLPLCSLETCTPLHQFDLIGFSLQYEVSYTNLLTMLDLGGIPLHATERGREQPLILCGGPAAQNPEPLAPFVDAFIIGDGEESLPWLMDRWMTLREADPAADREELLARLASSRPPTGEPYLYVPRFYEPRYDPAGQLLAMAPTRPDVPAQVFACTIDQDFDDVELPFRPVVPFVETTHDRIAIEIMRGCPWQCRFCQSTVIKRPLRLRSVETIVAAALESYRQTGYDEISLLSLSSSDYPEFERLVRRMHEVFSPLGVNVSLPSLRVNHQLRSLPALIRGVRNHGLTLAPEVARDDMREQIRKPVSNEDLYEGCREAFKNGWRRVKLYFLIGLPGERQVDLDGIVDMAERISRIGKEVRGRFVEVTASVSNFVPKPHTPYQWNGMQTEEYFLNAGRYLKQRCKMRTVRIRQHNIQRSLLEGLLTRGDRRIADVILEAWKRGSRFDAWDECFEPQRWWDVCRDLGVDAARCIHEARPMASVLPWDHVNVKKGRAYLEKEQDRSLLQLRVMADAVEDRPTEHFVVRP
ncbi:MAG TPA: TIGR03960 family B12-binding radical SAM protein [Gemmatales bacterium]|nr:TIGR03960 family B12-binding radical SAM protein [Gemmatales bacterium]HMP57979.1 TIGR03960 family B12-binding radical SAM protein [Gemmatales bacterium]